MDVDVRHPRPARALSLAAALLSAALAIPAVTALALGAPRAGAMAVAASAATPAADAAAPPANPLSGNASSSYTPSASNLEAREWFQNARFGIFLHWGLYSELGGVGTPGLSEWVMNDARIPAAKYERLASFFNPVHFDADAWVRQFKAAGARYIVITSKHHDGFAMFKSTVSAYNVVDATPFKRDPLATSPAMWSIRTRRSTSW
jgi:alpha-L-fucosidase